MGNQSTGKSTLLNHLFGTDFAVLDSSKERAQTTKGVWVAPIPSQGVVVWDIEGSDSLDRNSATSSYEQKTALFGAMVSNYLLVNLWVTDVGRKVGSNYTILSQAFEVGLQLYSAAQKETPKHLVYVVRGMSDRENEEAIRGRLVAEVKALWKEIGTRGDLYKIYYERLVHVDVFFVRDLFADRVGFDEDVATLRRFLLDPVPVPQFRNLDVGLLADFVEHAWQKIDASRDMNLPNMKYMVSLVRIMELKKGLVQKFERSLVKTPSGQEEGGTGFFRLVTHVHSQLIEKMTRETLHYDPTAVQTGLRELGMELEETFDRYFANHSTLNSVREFAKIEAWFRDNLRQDLPSFSMLDFLTRLKQQIHAADTTIQTEMAGLPLPPDKKGFYLDNFRRLFHSRIRENLSAAQNNFFGRISKNFAETFHQKSEKVAAELSKATWQRFSVDLRDSIERLRRDIDLLKTETIFGEALVDRIDKENLKPLVLQILKTLKSKVRNFGKVYLERYGRLLESTPADYLAKHDYASFHKDFGKGEPSVLRKFFGDVDSFLGGEEAVAVMGVSIVVFSKEDCDSLRKGFEVRARELFEHVKARKGQGIFGPRVLVLAGLGGALWLLGIPGMVARGTAWVLIGVLVGLFLAGRALGLSLVTPVLGAAVSGVQWGARSVRSAFVSSANDWMTRQRPSDLQAKSVRSSLHMPQSPSRPQWDSKWTS